jgi:hypothetical protein
MTPPLFQLKALPCFPRPSIAWHPSMRLAPAPAMLAAAASAAPGAVDQASGARLVLLLPPFSVSVFSSVGLWSATEKKLEWL